MSSGNAALASAKNKRGGSVPQPPVASTPVQKNSQPTSTTSANPNLQHPLQILYRHEQMLKKHDEELQTLITINNEDKPELNSGLIAKINSLEHEVSDLKKEIAKVMAFSMETSLQLSEFKKNKA
jgi:hypothetical protein